MRSLRLLALLPPLFLPGQSAAQPPLAYAYHDFRGKDLPPEWNLFGDITPADIRSEPEGLRITLPKGRKKALRGLSLPLHIQGDFEITTSFEVLHANVPASGIGSGVVLAINQIARVASVVRPDGEWWARWDRFKVEGKPGMRTGFSPRPARAGKLRLKRVGDTLHFQWAPAGEGQPFEDVHECEFGAEDITVVRLIPAFSDEQSDLDIRLVDLRIRTSGQADDSESPAPQRRGLMLAVVVLLGILVAAGVWLAVRHSRRRGR